MEEPTFPYAVANRAGVPRTRSSPCARRRRPRRWARAALALWSPDATRERYRGVRSGHARRAETAKAGPAARARPRSRASAASLRLDPHRQVWIETISGMMRMATMFSILIIGLIAGPAGTL